MPKGDGEIWNQQAGCERLQEHKGLLLNFVLAVKPQIAVNILAYFSSSSFLSVFTLFPSSSHFTTPPTSTTLPVLPPFTSPVRIYFVLANLEQQGVWWRDNGNWAEVNRAVATSCTAWWSFHQLGNLSNSHNPTWLPLSTPAPHGLLN